LLLLLFFCFHFLCCSYCFDWSAVAAVRTVAAVVTAAAVVSSISYAAVAEHYRCRPPALMLQLQIRRQALQAIPKVASTHADYADALFSALSLRIASTAGESQVSCCSVVTHCCWCRRH
jgi:hypothetical protein